MKHRFTSDSVKGFFIGVLVTALVMSATPVNAGVEDNVGLSVIASVIGAYNDVASAHTLFGAINGLSSSISGLSSAISSSTNTITAKIDAQTTTLSNKIGSISAGSASKALPTGSTGTIFTIGSLKYIIISTTSDSVRCAWLGSLGTYTASGGRGAGSSTTVQPYTVLASQYLVSSASTSSSGDLGILHDYMSEYVNLGITRAICTETNAQAVMVWTSGYGCRWEYPSHNIDGWETATYAAIPVYTIYRK